MQLKRFVTSWSRPAAHYPSVRKFGPQNESLVVKISGLFPEFVANTRSDC
jgi:hypothetical protein